MKVKSLAIMALLGHVTAIQIKNSNLQGESQLGQELEMEDMDRPADTILLQTNSDIKYPEENNLRQFIDRNNQQEVANRLRANLQHPRSFYENHTPARSQARDNTNGQESSGSESSDSEDEGNETQTQGAQGQQGQGFRQKEQPKLRSADDFNMVQTSSSVNDHDNDDDDIPFSYDAAGVDAQHNGMESDFDLLQIGSKIKKDDNDWKGYFAKSATDATRMQQELNQKMEETYAQEDDDSSYVFVQLNKQEGRSPSQYNHENDVNDIPEDDPSFDPIELKKETKRLQESKTIHNLNQYNHENDTEDIPEDPPYDPIELLKHNRRRGEPLFPELEHLSQKDTKQYDDFAEVKSLMGEQAIEDSQHIYEINKEEQKQQKLVQEEEMKNKEIAEQQEIGDQILRYQKLPKQAEEY